MDHLDPIRNVIDSALTDVYNKTGFKTLMVTRTIDNDWVAYRVLDQGGDIRDGQVFDWSSSICSRRMRNEGPDIAPDVEEIPAYAAAPIRQDYPCRAYFGIPMVAGDGSLIGMFCGMDPDARPRELLAMKETLDHHAKTITALLKARMYIVQKQRAMEAELPVEFTDPLTQLGSRRAWDLRIEVEEARHESTGGVGAVIAISLEAGGPAALETSVIEGDYQVVRCARAIHSVMRPGYFSARFCGDEFGVLLAETSSGRASEVCSEISTAVRSAGLVANFGLALRTADCPFEKAALIADSRMNDERLHRRRALAA